MADQLLSLLSGEQIKEEALVEGGDEGLFRASTYDLSIGEIIPCGGIPSSEPAFLLAPSGMVRVISKESLHLPDTITGHVLLKNQLCTQGVLAISIGIVDPGFEGPISSTLINFGREKCEIKKGDPFLRVSFLRCPPSGKAQKSQKHSREGYLQRVRQEVLAYSGPTFLNMDTIATNAAEQAFVSFRDGLVVWATLVAVLIAIIAIFAPLGASFVDRQVTSKEQHDVQMKQAIEKDVEERYENRLKTLSDEIDAINQKQQMINAGGRNAPAGKR
jgi:deoxycytidine triphosphate deaminase